MTALLSPTYGGAGYDETVVKAVSDGLSAVHQLLERDKSLAGLPQLKLLSEAIVALRPHQRWSEFTATLWDRAVRHHTGTGPYWQVYLPALLEVFWEHDGPAKLIRSAQCDYEALVSSISQMSALNFDPASGFVGKWPIPKENFTHRNFISHLGLVDMEIVIREELADKRIFYHQIPSVPPTMPEAFAFFSRCAIDSGTITIKAIEDGEGDAMDRIIEVHHDHAHDYDLILTSTSDAAQIVLKGGQKANSWVHLTRELLSKSWMLQTKDRS